MRTRLCGAALIALPIFLLLMLPWALPAAEWLAKVIPPCAFNEATGLFCPGCGVTRSILALLGGDIVLSLRYNPIVLLLLIVGAMAYAEAVFNCFGRRIKIMPRRLFPYIAAAVLLIIFYVARNIYPPLMPIFIDIVT